jgi:hypothetical protein
MIDNVAKAPRTLRANLRAYFLISVVGSGVLLLGTIDQGTAFAQGDRWFVGKGAEPGTYYTYEIQNLDTNQGRPFLMTIYLQEFDDANNYWVAPVYVVDQGNVYNGTLHLSDLDLSALGTSIVPPELAPYRNAYTSSIQWLSSFVPKPGQSLSAPSWGKIAAIGGSEIMPIGSSEVTTPAGTFDTTDISWRYGATNHVYVNPNLPYPVKAETFAGVTTGNAPIQYAFELQNTGTGEPPTPESQAFVPEPPLQIRTPRGEYIIQLIWNPPIEAAAATAAATATGAGGANASGISEEFGVIFMNDREQIITGVTYGFTVTSSNGTVISESGNQRATDGTGQFSTGFPEPGRYTIEVDIESVAGQPLGMFVESARFGVVAE